MFTHSYVLRVAILLVLIGPATPAVHAQDAEEIIKGLQSKIDNFKSFSADMTMTMTMSGMTVKSSGDVIVLDERLAMNMALDMMGQKMVTRNVVDASGMMWTETDMGGMKQIMKMDMKVMAEYGSELTGLPTPGTGFGGNPVEAVEQMLETFDLTLDGKDTIDGVEVYRLSADIKEEFKEKMDPSGQMAQMGLSLGVVKMAIGVDDGFPREYSMMDEDGNPFMAIAYSNLVVNPDIDVTIFDYAPPEGMQVIDMTEMMKQQMDSAGSAPDVPIGLGSIAPDFTGTDLRGDTVNLSDYKGKVVLVDFWATWCGPCIRELPSVIEAYKSYHYKGFEIVAISLDESKDDLDAFLKDHPDMTWVQIFDGKGWDSDIAVQYGVEGIPFTLLLDKEGNIVRQDLRGASLENALADLLGG